LPFKSYKEKIDLVKKNPNHFSFGMFYKLDEGKAFHAFPENMEESKIFTPHLIEMYEGYWNHIRSIGQSKYSDFPISTFEELKEEFLSKYQNSPIPEKFVTNEIQRIEKILSITSVTIKKSFEEEYNSIINSEQVLFNYKSQSDETTKFYLSTLTRPLAKYKIFLESESFKEPETIITDEFDIAEESPKIKPSQKIFLDFSSITNKVIASLIAGLILFAVTHYFTNKSAIDSSETKTEKASDNYKDKLPNNEQDTANVVIENIPQVRTDKSKVNTKFTLSGNKTYKFYNDSLTITIKNTTKFTNPIIEFSVNETGVDTTMNFSKKEVGDKFQTKNFEIIFMQTVYANTFYRDFVLDIKRKMPLTIDPMKRETLTLSN